MAAITTAAVTAGATVYSANKQEDAINSAANAQRESSNAAISEQQQAREQFASAIQPYTTQGYRAVNDLSNEANRVPGLYIDPNESRNRLNQVERAQFEGAQQVDAGGFNQTLNEVNPLVGFLRDEGFRDIQESAAAKGKLSSGGTLRDLARFNNNLASTIVPQLQQQKFNQGLQNETLGLQSQQAGAGIQNQNFNQTLQGEQLGLKAQDFRTQQQAQRFSQLQNIAAMGANAITRQGTLAGQTAANIGNLNLAAGQNAANSAIQQSNITTNQTSALAGLAGDALEAYENRGL